MQKQHVHDFIEYSDEKLTKRIIFKDKNSSTFVLNFQPGQTLPAHKHPGANVYLLVLTGEGMFTIDGEEVSVVKGDAITVEGDEELAFTNNGNENVSLYVTLSKIPSEKYVQEI
ncbi:cupin domain-containing protein [Aquibacillus sediminis]|uniref:cupin domain-containing protein n=1 Tax=Aquibacillus sediminis TaxID=2574734 RepID=UPI001108ADD4|nr:cupin domain-containing protein [Aquibacillus sediminis]